MRSLLGWSLAWVLAQPVKISLAVVLVALLVHPVPSLPVGLPEQFPADLVLHTVVLGHGRKRLGSLLNIAKSRDYNLSDFFILLSLFLIVMHIVAMILLDQSVKLLPELLEAELLALGPYLKLKIPRMAS